MKKNGVVYRTKFPVNDRETEFEIHKGVRKGKEILYIRAFDKVENREICGVRTEQLYRKDDEKQIGQMILRCVQKMNERYKAEREYIDLCARFKALHAREKHMLCPADWKAESTRNSALAMFQGTTAPIMEELATGTHDYTFPLSPYGAQYAHDYLDFRAENDPAGRLEMDAEV